MGEAVKKLYEEMKSRHSEIPWKNISGTRDKLIHDYFGVNIDIVWDIVINDIPDLRLKVQNILSHRTGSQTP